MISASRLLPLLLIFLSVGCGPHLKSQQEQAHDLAVAQAKAKKEIRAAAAQAVKQRQIDIAKAKAEAVQKRLDVKAAYEASEVGRIKRDCRAHGGLQEITPESLDTERDAGATDYFLVICKDGAGPFKESADAYSSFK